MSTSTEHMMKCEMCVIDLRADHGRTVDQNSLISNYVVLYN